MRTRGEARKLITQFCWEESIYWVNHTEEYILFVNGGTRWDGYHWTEARKLVQKRDWIGLKHYMDTMGETHLREQMESLMASSTPRLYKDIWMYKNDTTTE